MSDTELRQEGAGEDTAHRSGSRALWLTMLVAVAAGLGVVLAVGFGRDPGLVDSQLIGKPAPPLAGTTLDGGAFDLLDHRGEVVLVNVWASWCPPCVEEFPVLMDAAEQLGPHGLQVVGMNSSDRAADARAFLADTGATDAFPHVDDSRGDKAVDWGVFGLPETFVIDRQGRVRAKVVGILGYEWIEAEVVPLLAEDA